MKNVRLLLVLSASLILHSCTENLKNSDGKKSHSKLVDKKGNFSLETFNKDHNNFNDSNTKLKVDKSVNIFKENSLEKVNNFDRLKNILDIRSNDIQQRLSLIIEKNIRLNNNKFEIQLLPENLGKIQITLEITGQNVDININSDNISTIQSLTENNNSLQKMLQSQGMNLNNWLDLDFIEMTFTIP